MKSDDRIPNGGGGESAANPRTSNTNRKDPRSVYVSSSSRRTNVSSKTDRQSKLFPFSEGNISSAAKRKRRVRTALKYLSLAALFSVTVAVIGGICLAAAEKSAKPIGAAAYSDSDMQDESAPEQNYQKTGSDDSISPIDAAYEKNSAYEVPADYITFSDRIVTPENDPEEETLHQSGELKKTAAPKVTTFGDLISPVDEPTLEYVDLYESGADTDIFIGMPSEGEMEQDPEPVPLNPEPDTDAPPQRETEASPEPAEEESGVSYENPVYYNVTLKYIRQDNITCTTAASTVGELLNSMGITLSKLDMDYIDVNQAISSDCVIQMEVAETKIVALEEKLPYDTEYKESGTVPKGNEKVVSEGVHGIRVKEYTAEYINGTLISEAFSKEYIKRYPSPAVVEKGIGGTITGADGTVYSYTHYLDVKSTTYTGGGITASGIPADESVIAVDPKVIPLNTKVYVKGDYGDFGVRIAADIGGGIKNNIIDVYLDSDNPYFADFGWRNMRVYFIEE